MIWTGRWESGQPSKSRIYCSCCCRLSLCFLSSGRGGGQRNQAVLRRRRRRLESAILKCQSFIFRSLIIKFLNPNIIHIWVILHTLLKSNDAKLKGPVYLTHPLTPYKAIYKSHKQEKYTPLGFLSLAYLLNFMILWFLQYDDYLQLHQFSSRLLGVR